MNKLEMTIEIAKMEKIKTDVINSRCYSVLSPDEVCIYDPIDDLALNCMLRDKYEVGIDYNVGSCISIHGDLYIEICFGSKESISNAVIECILKVNDLWVES